MTNSPFKITELASGLKIITAEMPYMESVAIGIWANLGNRYESQNQAGISHFLEHVNFKGTKKRNARQISQAIESVGGSINGFTSEEVTCYYAKVRHPKFDTALDVLLDLYKNSAYKTEYIELERKVIIEEIKMYNDMPQQLVYEDFNKISWQGHPLGRPVLGTIDSVKNITRKDLIEYRNNYYVPSNTVISVAGNVTHEKVVKSVTALSKGWRQTGNPNSYLPYKGVQRTSRFSFNTKPIEQAHLVLGFKSFGKNDPDRFSLKILSTIIGENMSSRLNNEIREKRGLAYSVNSHVSRYRDTGAFQIGVSADANNLKEVIKIILKICGKISNNGIKKNELKHAKEFVRGCTALALERTSDYMIWLGENLLTTGKIQDVGELIDKYDKVSLEDVQRVAKRIFVKKKLNCSIVSPKINTKEIKDIVGELE